MTPWRLIVMPRALRDLEKLPKGERDQVQAGMGRLAADPSTCDIKKLTQGGGELWRLRVGRWRIRFRFLKAEQVIEVLRVLPREKAYGDL